MGSDVTLNFEKKIGASWNYLSNFGEMPVDRNYELYAALGYTHHSLSDESIPPISSNTGLPLDVSADMRRIADNYEDEDKYASCFTYFTLAELFAYQWNHPYFNDSFSLAGVCRSNTEFSLALAQSILGYSKTNDNDSFLQKKAINLLASVLLHFSEFESHFNPAGIIQFLSDHSTHDTLNIDLANVLNNSPSFEARALFSNTSVQTDSALDALLSNLKRGLQTFVNNYNSGIGKSLTFPESSESFIENFLPLLLQAADGQPGNVRLIVYSPS